MDFKLRKWNITDADSFFKYCQSKKIAQNMRASFPATLKEAEAVVESFCKSDEKRQCCRAVEINGEAAGSIAIFLKDDVYTNSNKKHSGRQSRDNRTEWLSWLCRHVSNRNKYYCKSAELSYWLGEPFWGRGVISKAIKEICETAFSQYDIVRIFAEPYAYNTGSRKALEKAGFILEGVLKKNVYKNGEFYDSCVYALFK
jgi:[ribosomal protein S5]-alanine N-acetyltransferase